MQDLFAVVFVVLVVAVVWQSAVVVPQQSVYLVERLGRFRGALQAGFHLLVPFADVVRHKISLKETAVDVAEQVCITRDNVQVRVDGVLYVKVVDAERAAYGVNNFLFAIVQLAQTAMRSEIGKIDLDRTFEERTKVNDALVLELDQASEPWGVKVLRYEIRNISPPQDVLAAMEKQMRAEREKRAVILNSEGVRDAKINSSEGEKQERIKQSEATRQQRVNEAQGSAEAILSIARATAQGLREVAEATQVSGGAEAAQLRLAEAYIQQFGELARKTNTMIVPANIAEPASMLAMALKVARRPDADGKAG